MWSITPSSRPVGHDHGPSKGDSSSYAAPTATGIPPKIPQAFNWSLVSRGKVSNLRALFDLTTFFGATLFLTLSCWTSVFTTKFVAVLLIRRALEFSFKNSRGFRPLQFPRCARGELSLGILQAY